jgi:NADH-quinone oxidoreductase subunit N
MGKLYLIEAAVGGDYTWLGVLIVIGSMISLAYYLRVVAAVWMRPSPRLSPAIAGGSPEADVLPAPRTGEPGRTPDGRPSGGRCLLVLGAIVIAATATVVFGVVPSPLIDFTNHAGQLISSLPG